MKIKVSVFLVFVILFVLVCSGSFAEVIYLKNGKVVKEKIIERGSYYIVTEKDGIPRKYYDGQIDRIEEDAMDTSNIDIDQFQAMGMSPEKAKLIVTLLNVSGVRGNMQESIAQLLERVPEEKRAYYQGIFNIEEIIERLIPLYDKYYSTVDLQGSVSFYESPAGKRALEVTPEIMKESLDILLKYVEEKTGP